MKFIHTSDWHLGHSLKGRNRHAEHEQFLAWLLKQVKAHQVDALIVAGDIFDTTAPSSRAREIYQAFIADLHHTACHLIVLGGNHDSVAVLNESKHMASALNTYVIPSTGVAIEEQVITLFDKQQNQDSIKKHAQGHKTLRSQKSSPQKPSAQKPSPQAIVCAVPFIRAADVMRSEAGQSAEEKKQNLGEAIAQHYQRLFEIAQSKQQALLDEYQIKVPIVATGHLTAVGASLSESVREIYIGTLEAFSVKGFPDADYIALGHIHKPQVVGKQAHIRYSGSPIPLSFDELNYQKQINLIEFSQRESVSGSANKQTSIAPENQAKKDQQANAHINESPQIDLLAPADDCEQVQASLSKATDIVDMTHLAYEAIPVPLFQKLVSISGDLASLQTQINELKVQFEDESVWLNVKVEKEAYRADLNQKIQDMLSDSQFELLVVQRISNETSLSSFGEALERVSLEELKPETVFEHLLTSENIDKTDEDYDVLLKLFKQVTHSVELEQEQSEVNELSTSLNSECLDSERVDTERLDSKPFDKEQSK